MLDLLWLSGGQKGPRPTSLEGLLRGMGQATGMPPTTEADALTSVGDFTGLGQPQGQQQTEFNPLQDTLLGTRSSNITFR